MRASMCVCLREIEERGQTKARQSTDVSFLPSLTPSFTRLVSSRLRLLGEEAAALMDGARQAVAGNLKTALQVPLQEICKVVVEAKCPRVRSLRKLRSTVEGECAKWVRRSEPLGATLSPGMVKRVLALFVDADLPECKAQVTNKERTREGGTLLPWWLWWIEAAAGGGDGVGGR